jgi:hypothetical protein
VKFYIPGINLFPLVPDGFTIEQMGGDKFSLALMQLEVITLEAQLWAWQRGLTNLLT